MKHFSSFFFFLIFATSVGKTHLLFFFIVLSNVCLHGAFIFCYISVQACKETVFLVLIRPLRGGVNVQDVFHVILF